MRIVREKEREAGRSKITIIFNMRVRATFGGFIFCILFSKKPIFESICKCSAVALRYFDFPFFATKIDINDEINQMKCINFVSVWCRRCAHSLSLSSVRAIAAYGNFSRFGDDKSARERARIINDK